MTRLALAAILTDEEAQYICSVISAKAIKHYFQKNPRDYEKLRPACRAVKLDDQRAIGLACRYREKGFIADFIGAFIETFLKDVQDAVNTLEKDGASHSEAMLRTLADSPVFSDHIELYFKLEDNNTSDEYIAMVKACVALCNRPAHESKVLADDSKSVDDVDKTEMAVLKENNTQLDSLVKQLEQELLEEREASEQRASALEEERDALQRALKQAQQDLDAAANRLKQAEPELERLQRLASYADMPSEDASSSDNHHTSLCRVMMDASGRPLLERLADITQSRMAEFKQDPTRPFTFENRKRLFWRDGPSAVGAIGIWNWYPTPNDSDPKKDYIHSTFCRELLPVEVRVLPQCADFDDLLDRLQEGIPASSVSEKTLFAMAPTDEMYHGVLSGARDFDIRNDTARLRGSVFMLPVFHIPAWSTLSFAGKDFCKNLNLGMPQDIMKVKDPIAMVKDIILKRANQTNLRQLGLSKKEAQKCQEYLRSLATEDLYREISEKYDCTIGEAERYAAQFIELADSYLNESDIDGNLLAQAIARNSGLAEKCKESLSEEWETENEERIRLARQALSEIEASADAHRNKLSQAKAEFADLQRELADVNMEIQEKRTLAHNVEEKVAERIAKAREDAASFISDMAFAMPLTTRETSVPSDQRAGLYVSLHPVHAKSADTEIDDILDFEDELAANLEQVGYSTERAATLAQILLFCIGQQLPLVCNAHANALSECIAAMFGPSDISVFHVPIGGSCFSELRSALLQCGPSKVCLINGALDAFSPSVFNFVSQMAHELDVKILIFSSEGIVPDALPDPIWSKAFYIDGDIGLTSHPKGPLWAYRTTADLRQPLDPDRLKQAQNQLRPFLPVISNRAFLNYADFAAATDADIKTDECIIPQIVLSARACGKKDELIKILEARNIPLDAKPIARNL